MQSIYGQKFYQIWVQEEVGNLKLNLLAPGTTSKAPTLQKSLKFSRYPLRTYLERVMSLSDLRSTRKSSYRLKKVKHFFFQG